MLDITSLAAWGEFIGGIVVVSLIRRSTDAHYDADICAARYEMLR